MEVKKGLEKKYQKHVKINASFKRKVPIDKVIAGFMTGKHGYTREDYQGLAYNLSVLAATEAVGADLSAGKKPKEADKKIGLFELSIFQAGCVANNIREFHPRGEEFREWWNDKFNYKGKGTVNPAVLEIKEK